MVQNQIIELEEKESQQNRAEKSNLIG
jgi:hypothetical protein